jgi:hypothetical protein
VATKAQGALKVNHLGQSQDWPFCYAAKRVCL